MALLIAMATEAVQLMLPQLCSLYSPAKCPDPWGGLFLTDFPKLVLGGRKVWIIYKKMHCYSHNHGKMATWLYPAHWLWAASSLWL